ncbi:hypothetical protein EYD10_12644, partial [Varanus komodoensis]
MSRRHTRSRSPHEKKKRRSHSHTKSKARSHSPSASPGKQSVHKNTTHSTSVSPVESRESSQERSGGVSLEKDGQISSAIVSSVQSKITQDLMAKQQTNKGILITMPVECHDLAPYKDNDTNQLKDVHGIAEALISHGAGDLGLDLATAHVMMWFQDSTGPAPRVTGETRKGKCWILRFGKIELSEKLDSQRKGLHGGGRQDTLQRRQAQGSKVQFGCQEALPDSQDPEVVEAPSVRMFKDRLDMHMVGMS